MIYTFFKLFGVLFVAFIIALSILIAVAEGGYVLILKLSEMGLNSSIAKFAPAIIVITIMSAGLAFVVTKYGGEK